MSAKDDERISIGRDYFLNAFCFYYQVRSWLVNTCDCSQSFYHAQYDSFIKKTKDPIKSYIDPKRSIFNYSSRKYWSFSSDQGLTSFFI
jgi:hypothetical protein